MKHPVQQHLKLRLVSKQCSYQIKSNVFEKCKIKRAQIRKKCVLYSDFFDFFSWSIGWRNTLLSFFWSFSCCKHRISSKAFKNIDTASTASRSTCLHCIHYCKQVHAGNVTAVDSPAPRHALPPPPSSIIRLGSRNPNSSEIPHISVWSSSNVLTWSKQCGIKKWVVEVTFCETV